jgi:hypothetical protein
MTMRYNRVVSRRQWQQIEASEAAAIARQEWEEWSAMRAMHRAEKAAWQWVKDERELEIDEAWSIYAEYLSQNAAWDEWGEPMYAEEPSWADLRWNAEQDYLESIEDAWEWWNSRKLAA